VDTVARVGGEEFCVLLDHADTQHAVAWATATLQKIAAITFVTDAALIKVTASLGIASTSQVRHHTRERVLADELLQQADRAMYRAKQEGRNRVHVWEPVEESLSQHRLEKCGV
jgi:diguanylate cyclase (GGDEF)-like protein